MVKTIVMRAEPLVLQMKKKVSAQVSDFKRKTGNYPKLVAILAGDDPASRTYVELKRGDCSDVGIISEVRDLSNLTAEKLTPAILKLIVDLNLDKSVNAVIPQMPLGPHLSAEEVFSILSPDKDVDGLTPYRLGKLLRKEYSLESSLLPCTPKGIIQLVKHYQVPVKGTDVAIVGRGLLVGEPLRKLFQDMDATATCYHTSSKNLAQHLKDADIVVAASGRPPEIYGSSGFRISSGMVKEGSTVIGAGVKRNPETGKMLFDVDTKSLDGICGFVTPNTGGVGAMTRAALIQNAIIAANLQAGISD